MPRIRNDLLTRIPSPHRSLASACLRHWTWLLLMPLLLGHAQSALAQTPSPLQEWQYSSGIVLARLFEPDLPQWRTIVGLAAETEPEYPGSRAYEVTGGPVVNINYRDEWFISTGDGIGYNFLRGDHYQVGLAMTYDLGRKMHDDWSQLAGMGNIDPTVMPKLYATWVLSKTVPVVLRVDARQYIGGDNGLVGDAGLYLPLPGSSKRFVMFAGPSITMATHLYMQTLYGVSEEQSRASGHPVYSPHAGTAAAGVGFSATGFLTDHWLVNLDTAIDQIRGSPAHSPLVQSRTQRILAVSLSYNF